jgi:hypothetical protein
MEAPQKIVYILPFEWLHEICLLKRLPLHFWPGLIPLAIITLIIPPEPSCPGEARSRFEINKYGLKKPGDFIVSEGHGYPLVSDNMNPPP